MAINYGGGLKCANGGELYVNRSTIAVNKGSGVLIDNCTATIMSSQVNNNTCIPYHQFPFPLYYMSGVGAGITVVGATANIENSTISNNICHSYYGGGGISIFDSTVTISNSTISGNESFYCAGGICAFRKFTDQPIVDLTLSQVTVVSNRSIHSSGGIANQTLNSSTLITLSQSIIAGNQDILGAPLQSEILNENGGNMQFDDFNLFGYENNSGFSINITPGASDLVPSAGLADIIDTNLTDNGGYTPTHALVPGSPAIDFVPAGSCASSTDQTGASRPIDGNLDGVAGCDVGAVEKPKPDLIFENGFEGGN